MFVELSKAFGKNKNSAKSGDLGRTSHFGAMYIRHIQIYHIAEHAVRETDTDLFITILTPIIDLYFATNQQSYVFWMSKYQLDELRWFASLSTTDSREWRLLSQTIGQWIYANSSGSYPGANSQCGCRLPNDGIHIVHKQLQFKSAVECYQE